MRAPSRVAAAHVPSIAVLPFDDLSPDKSIGYLGDGVSEDIITMLSRFPDLSVIARNSSFVYKGKPIDIRQVGRDLNVDYALEGSVRKETRPDSHHSRSLSTLRPASMSGPSATTRLETIRWRCKTR